jgi:hypothetical protein
MATISIADNDARVQYTQAVTANTTQLTIDFPFFDYDDINVIVTSAAGVDTTLTRGTGTGTFAVTGTSVDDGYSGGYVTLGDTYSDSSTKYTIFRDIDVERTTDFPTSGPFNVSSLNTELDKIFAIEQELETKVSRTIKLTDSDSSASATLPAAAERANKYLAFDSSGDPTVLAGTADPLSSVDTAQLVDDAVTQAKIADSAVGTDQLAADAVTQAKIADDAVGSSQIADNAVALATQTTGNYVADITAGNAITTSGGGSENATVTVNHADTSSQASVNNSGNTVIQDVTLDTYGHVTALTSATIDTTPVTTLAAIGTYAFLYNSGGSMSPGNTDSATDLSYSNAAGSTTTLSVGTWRLMGHHNSTGSVEEKTSLYVRIS